jgi:hypothetical protein
MTYPSSSLLKTGTHGAYQWLRATQHDLDSLLVLSPSVVIGKHLAVTSFDSGSLLIDDVEKSTGWESRGGIAYSPRIESAETLPPRGGYDEWYVFGARADLGQIGKDNVFEAPLQPGQVEVFVNFGPSFALELTADQTLANLFWRQLDWIRPDSYLADNDHLLTFVTADPSLFAEVHRALIQDAP